MSLAAESHRNGADMEYTIFQYIYFFFLYSFIGWVFEEVLAAFKYGRFVNRGFVNGPLCMKYGFCMIVILTDVSDLMDNPFFTVCHVFCDYHGHSVCGGGTCSQNHRTPPLGLFGT